MAVPSISNISGEGARLQVVSVLRRIPNVIKGCEGVSLDVHIVARSIRNDSYLHLVKREREKIRTERGETISVEKQERKYHWVA
jgi:hypothetical protein